LILWRLKVKDTCFKYLRIFLIMGLFCSWAMAGQAANLRIGVAVPLTGTFGKDGALVKDAYAFWAETMNAKGGVKIQGQRFPVELIFYDDQSDPQLSAKLVEKLVKEDKVDLLLGGFGSSQVMAASAVSERLKYPMISGSASSNALFTRGFKYYFSTLGKATEEVRGVVEVFSTVKSKPKTVAIIGANIPFTAQACDGFELYAQKFGFVIIHKELFPLSLQDYNTLLQKIKAKNPDVLLVGSHMSVALRVMKAMKEIDFNPKAVGFSYGPTVPGFVQGLGKDTEYVLAASEWTPNLPYRDAVFGTAADLNKSYFQKYNRYPDFVEVASIGGALAQQISMEELGLKPPLKEEDRVRLMEKLHRINIMTSYGQIQFGEDGANVDHPPVAVQVQKGKLVNVYPKKAAEGELWYPMPAWKDRH
jgi:branched-chain amino acid transport system substrate-binding protein